MWWRCDLQQRRMGEVRCGYALDNEDYGSVTESCGDGWRAILLTLRTSRAPTPAPGPQAATHEVSERSERGAACGLGRAQARERQQSRLPPLKVFFPGAFNFLSSW